MRRWLLVCWIAVTLLPPARAQVTANILTRVLYVRVAGGTRSESTATAFTVDVDGRQYVITAKHVVAGLKADDSVDVFKSEKWTPIKFKIFRCEDPIDIAVLIPPQQLTPSLPITFEPTFMYGQEAYFLGFPYGFFMNAPGLNGDYPLAFIKRATISGTHIMDVQKKATMLLLDGHNNPGFSGGPIVYRDYNAPNLTIKLLGVTSGFVPEVVPAMTKHDIKSRDDAGPESKAQPWRIQQNPDKTWFEYQDSASFVALNTGIIQGYEIEPAIDLIRQHPIGPTVATQP